MGSMISVNTILESVGINHSDLAARVAEAKRTSNEPAPAGVTVEALACAVEQLASRLAGIAERAEDEFEDYYIGGICGEVFDMATGDDDKDPLELLWAHLGLDGVDAALTSSPVFGHPDLRCVNHKVLDHALGTVTSTDYLIDVRTGDITPVAGGPVTGAAA